jgi:exodeoxyribonuclease V gamma subunit
MPGLKLYTSNRMEILAVLLADVLKLPLNQPLASEIILVQSKGMERWLSMELSKRHGICANVRFPYPIHFIHGLFQEMSPELPEHSPYEPMIMAWDIMGVIPSLLDHPGFQTIKAYLEGALYDLKHFQFSVRVADLYDQYLLFRPDMILRWDRGADDNWQAILWRELVKKKGNIHRAALYDTFLRTLKHSRIPFRTVPERISIFGISALPPFHIQIFHALSSTIDVNLFLMNPCREFWADIVSDREMNRYITKRKIGDVLPSELYLETGNPLLASMGSLGREFFHLIGEIPCEEVSEFIDPGQKSLLSAIQSDILNLRKRMKTDSHSIPESDNSIQVHSCHSLLREVEVLQDSLLGFIENNPDVRPDDILVMIPDIESYAPFIQAVFSIPPDDPRWLPFTIADKGILHESGLIETFLKLLDLAGCRFGVSRVLDVLDSDTVRSKFLLSEEDLELIHHWIRETGIRWGIDAQNKEMLDLPPSPWNTWRSGLDRMLLGYAMAASHEDELFMGIFPFHEIEGVNAEILGRFLQFMETLSSSMEKLEDLKTLSAWEDSLRYILDRFFSDDEAYIRDIQAIRHAVQELQNSETCSRFTEKIGLDVIKAWLRQNLKERGFGTGFLTGGVTFCTILPMRSIPFKNICLIGMNDDSYPRKSLKLGFDLMSASPRIGDRSRRMDDRYLFLEAILSARQKLHISYVGQSMKDNSTRPPSVLVSELLDYVEEGFGKSMRDEIIIHHRLQTFSPAYFSGGKKLFSYSEENLRAAQVKCSCSREASPFISGALSEPEEEWRMIDLGSLHYFFSNPARFLLKRRLGIHLSEGPTVTEDSEPFELTKLDEYIIKQELTERAVKNTEKPMRDLYPVMQASGRLPHGSPGECCFDSLCTSTEEFMRIIHPLIKEGRREPISVDIAIGEFLMTGCLANLFSEGFVFYRPAKIKARDRLSAWLSHLVVNHASVYDETAKRTILICEDRTLRYSPVEDAEAYLRNILNIYWRGLRKPLHFFPESSLAYAEQVYKGADPAKAMRTAQGKWDAFQFGEKEDAYYDLCFRQIDPMDAEFRELAIAIFSSMMKHEEQIK